jgi:hypothetical protein
MPADGIVDELAVSWHFATFCNLALSFVFPQAKLFHLAARSSMLPAVEGTMAN